MKKSIFRFCIFSLIYLSILGINNKYPPFYAMEKTLIPLENGTVIFIYLILNYAITLIFMLDIIKILDDLLYMYPYIISRSSTQKISIYYFKKIFHVMMSFFLVKILADFVWGNVDGYRNIDKFSTLSISTFFTLIIWALFTEILFLKIQNQKKVLFLTTTIIFFLEYLSMKIGIFSIFTIGSINFYEHFWVIIFLKISLVIVLICVIMNLFKKVEVLGGDKYD